MLPIKSKIFHHFFESIVDINWLHDNVNMRRNQHCSCCLHDTIVILVVYLVDSAQELARKFIIQSSGQ